MTVQPAQWDSLSYEERTECTGEPRKFLCCEQHVWTVKGGLQADWNQRVQPQINTLIYSNYKQVFGKRGVQAVLSFHLYLLSPTEDPGAARPTIFILTADKKAASRARKLILKHEIFKQLNTGFDVLFERKSIFMRADGGQARGPRWSMKHTSLCGAPIKVTPDLRPADRVWRRATIFCTIQISGVSFAVIPAHVFFPESNETGRSDAVVQVSGSESSDLSDDQSVGNSGSGEGSQSTDDDRGAYTREIEPGVPPMHAVYLDMDSTNSQSSTFLGFLDLDVPSLSHSFGPMYSRPLDYCLLQLDEGTFTGPNYIHTPDQRIILANSFQTTQSISKAFLASGSHGSREVEISHTATSLLFPWSPKPCTVWQIDGTLEPGDSGSPVFGTSDVIIGMAVATVSEHNISYVLRASDILEDIWSSRALTAQVMSNTHNGVSASSLLDIQQPPTTSKDPFVDDYPISIPARQSLVQSDAAVAGRHPSSKLGSRWSIAGKVAKNHITWQEKLARDCVTLGFPAPSYRIVTDKRGGRTAYSATVTVKSQAYAARYWYDVGYLENAREDAAEVACSRLRNPRPPGSRGSVNSSSTIVN